MCRERLGAQSQLSQGHFWVWLASPGGKRKILGREGSWPLRRGPLHSPECWPRGAHSFLAGKLQEKTSWACLSPGPARLGSPLTPWRHQGGHRGCWKAKENLKDGARPEGNPPPPPSTSPVGKDASLKARARGKAEQDPPLKLLGQSQASRI